MEGSILSIVGVITGVSGEAEGFMAGVHSCFGKKCVLAVTLHGGVNVMSLPL